MIYNVLMGPLQPTQLLTLMISVNRSIVHLMLIVF